MVILSAFHYDQSDRAIVNANETPAGQAGAIDKEGGTSRACCDFKQVGDGPSSFATAKYGD